MRRKLFTLSAAILILLAAGHESQAQRRGGGGGRVGGGAVGGARVGGGAVGGARVGGAAVGPYGGAGAGTRAGGTVIGPAGGSRSVGGGSGSYTTGRGTTIEAGGIGRSATGPGGVTAGRGVGGVQVTTPGGRTATKVGTAGGIAGPGGNAIGGTRGVTTGSGPNGSFGSAYRGGVAVGPQGAAVGGSRVGTATGIGGTVTGGTRGAAAVGPYGAAAGRAGVVAGPGGVAVGGARVGRTATGTYYASRFGLAGTGATVRGGFGYYNAFTPGWYARYPGAWFAAGWTAARIWSTPAWGTVATYCSFPTEPLYYDYGETVVYSDNTFTINGETQVPAAEYTQQAVDLATTGKEAKVEPKGEDFQPLGVFAMVKDGDEKSTNIFQLAVTKDGIIRGNYYNALTDTTEPVYGSVDKKTQRAAWTIGDKKSPVFEAGIANLTRDETTLLVHYGKDQPPQQFTLVRVPQPEGEQPPGGK